MAFDLKNLSTQPVTISFQKRQELLCVPGMFEKYHQNGTPVHICITREEQLHDYIQKIPDLLWDLLEYAEKPIAFQVPSMKALQNMGGITDYFLRFIPDQLISKNLQAVRKPVICLSGTNNSLGASQNVLTLNKNEAESFFPYKTMLIGENGEISFLK